MGDALAKGAPRHTALVHVNGYGYDEMWWADVYEPDDLEYSAPTCMRRSFTQPIMTRTPIGCDH